MADSLGLDDSFSLQEDRNLLFGLLISFLLHALLLSLHFQFPEVSRAIRDRALDIVLVNSKSARRPSNPQVLAQNNLDGGGTSDDRNALRSSPLPFSDRQQDGNNLEQPQTRRAMRAAENRQAYLLSEQGGKPTRRQSPRGKNPDFDPLSGAPDGVDLVNNALAMAKLQGAIERETQDYNARPRKFFESLQAHGISTAQYLEDWRQKIERVGTLNYPAEAKGKLYGELTLTVEIRRDGSVTSVEIDRSSGQAIFDDAARRIVAMASPFPPFPPGMIKDYDMISITRTWNFTNSDRRLGVQNRGAR